MQDWPNPAVVLFLIACWAALATLIKFALDIGWGWAAIVGAVFGIVLFWLPD